MKTKKIEGGRAEYYIHTHDLISYRRCRRRWSLSSPLRNHLQPKATVVDVNPFLWFGSGFHYAMEDRFGYNVFNDAKEAFRQYVLAHPIEERPVNWAELVDMGEGMISTYVDFEETHGTWKTATINGKPAVELNFALELEGFTHNGKPLAFGGTIDRIVEDIHGNYWLLDYKTAKAFDTQKLGLDTQISAYCWAAEQFFDIKVEGMLYVQVHKSPPKPPKLTQKGVSTDKRQRTSFNLYRDACLEAYGSWEATPPAQQEFSRALKARETSDSVAMCGNDFVSIEWVERNDATKANFFKNLKAMLTEMTNPELPIYPNPTKDCSWDCSFKELCQCCEEGGDVDFYLSLFESRKESLDDGEPKWFTNLKKNNVDLFK